MFLVFNVWVSWSTIGVHLFVFLVTNRLGIEWLAWLDLTWELDKNKRVLHDMSNNNSFFNNTVKRYLSIESTSFSGPGLCSGRQQYNSPVFNETFGCFLLYFCSKYYILCTLYINGTQFEGNVSNNNKHNIKLLIINVI